jgi:hypothetical protein
MTDDDKALDKIIRTSMPFDFERKETLSDDKALVERLRDESIVGMPMENEAAARIEAQAAEIERLREALLDVLVYAPDYMHGVPKKHYAKIAEGKAG